MTGYMVVMGIDDFVPRRPDWSSIGFLSGPVSWIFGVFMAVIIVMCAFYALRNIFALAGSDSTHRAKEAGIGIAYALIAAAGVYFFYDFFVGLIRSAGS